MSLSPRKLSILVGKNIQMKRKKLGLNQGAFAEKIGIGQQSLSAMERGEIAPKFERLPIIAEMLNCSLSDLFRLTSDEVQHYEASLVDIMMDLSMEERQLIMHMAAGMAAIFKKHRHELKEDKK